MSLALITIGLVLVITSVRGTSSQLYSMLVNDWKSGFAYWLIALVAVGLLGQVPALKQFSTWFLVLILLVLVLRNGGAVKQFEEAFNITPKGTS